MEDLEFQTNGCKFDLGTGEPLKNFCQKYPPNGTEAEKILIYFWSYGSMTVTVILRSMVFISIQY